MGRDVLPPIGRARVAIAEFRRHKEHPLVPDPHQLQSDRPSLDDAVRDVALGLGRLCITAVELGAAPKQLSAVVHVARCVDLWRLGAALGALDNFILKAARQDDNARCSLIILKPGQIFRVRADLCRWAARRKVLGRSALHSPEMSQVSFGGLCLEGSLRPRRQALLALDRFAPLLGHGLLLQHVGRSSARRRRRRRAHHVRRNDSKMSQLTHVLYCTRCECSSLAKLY